MMSKKRITLEYPRLNDKNFLRILNQLIYDHDFDIEVLEKFYMYFDMTKLIRSQKLSLEFIFKFIFENNDLDTEESYIDDSDIVMYQNYSYLEICEFRESRNNTR